MMSTAFCQAVLRRYPEAQVDLIVRKGFEMLPLPHRGELIPFDRDQMSAGRFGTQLRDRGYDRMYVLPPSFSAAWMAWRSGIPRRIGYAGDGRRWLLKPAMQAAWKPRSRHLVEEYLYLLTNEETTAEVLPQLALTETWREEQLHSLPVLPSGFVALAPGAIYGPAKQWPVENFREVARQLRQQRSDLSILVLGTPADELLGTEIAHELEGVENWCGRSNLPQLVAILSCAQLLLSNDSGSMHIMAALQRPQVAVFGSTSPTWTRPLNSQAQLVYRAEPCAPCFARTCPLGHTNCLKKIAPDQVVERILATLSENPVKI